MEQKVSIRDFLGLQESHQEQEAWCEQEYSITQEELKIYGYLLQEMREQAKRQETILARQSDE